MRKLKNIKRIIVTIMIIVLGFQIPIYAANQNYFGRMISLIREAINKEEAVKKEENENLEINKFSDEILSNFVKELDLDKESEKITLRDILQFIKTIKKVYKNVETGPQTITNSKQLAVLTSVNSSIEGAGPITITPAKLNDEEVTLITLGGTELKDGQATGVKEDLLSGIEQTNDYLVNVVKLFDEKDENGNLLIPKEKPIIVSGISLGGMVAQQLLAQEKLTKEYEFKAIICFGSPLIAPLNRNDETQIVRFCDTSDIVPFLGATFILDQLAQEILETEPAKIIEKLDNNEKILKDGGYKTFIGAHVLSYVSSDCWNEYDILGVQNGKNTITLKSQMKFYEAPVL